MPIEPTERLTVVLAAEQWNAILNLLAEAPYRVAVPLITEIQRQCMQQDRAAVGSGSVLRTARGNGQDRESVEP